MKKLLVAALALVVGTTMAFAASINVPQFLDSGLNDSNWPPQGESADNGLLPGWPNRKSIISLHNNLSTNLLCTIEYRDSNGFGNGPVGVNTFVIPAASTVSFRPFGTDPGLGDNADVPNVQRPAKAALDPNAAGSAVIQWSTPGALPTDIQGRLVEAGPGGEGWFGYLLPQGL